MLSGGISFYDKRVLVCPLDWGMGHAARCIPLIKLLRSQGNEVIVACNKWQREFLVKELPQVEFKSLFGYEVKYSARVPFGLKVLLQSPRLALLVKKEHAWLQVFVKKHKIDVVISDNRFGLYCKGAHCVFITHQLFVPAPFMKTIVNRLNSSFIDRFDECWVPDHIEEKGSLSGKLSHGDAIPGNVKYIGPLSRFTGTDRPINKQYDIVLLLSGVEPQRSLLEEKLVGCFWDKSLRIALVRGSHIPKKFPAQFTVVNIATSDELAALLQSAKNIICRSGYSTLMDLDALGLDAILIPTPGQTEQEYLASYWVHEKGFKSIEQEKIFMDTLLPLLKKEKTLPLQN